MKLFSFGFRKDTAHTKFIFTRLHLQLESHNQVNYFAKVSGVITSIQIVSKVTFEHIGTTHANLQTPLGSALRLFEMELGSGKPVSARGFSDQNSVKLTPWVESRGRSDRSALPSHQALPFLPHRSGPSGDRPGPRNSGKLPKVAGSRGGPLPVGDLGPHSDWLMAIPTVGGGLGVRLSGENLSHGVSLHGSACT